MNSDIRTLYLELIELLNRYESIPWEIKRIMLEDIQYKAEKQADKCINEELASEAAMKEKDDAEKLQQDQLGELSE